MCIEKVEAWSFDGKTFPTEGQAIRAAVGKLLSNEGIAQDVIDKSSALIPLLERVVEIEAEKQASRNPTSTAEPLKKVAGEPKQEHDAVMTAIGHAPEGDGSEHGAIMREIMR